MAGPAFRMTFRGRDGAAARLARLRRPPEELAPSPRVRYARFMPLPEPESPQAGPLPRTPSAEQWRALSPAARARFIDSVNAALSAPRERLMGDLEARYEAAQAQAEAAQTAERRARTEAILAILQVRGLTPSDEARARIEGCGDRALLERWFRRALTAQSVEELLAPG